VNTSASPLTLSRGPTWCSSSPRPIGRSPESERLFLATIRDWGKKIAIVVNKVDIFSKGSELEDVLTFVRNGARDLLGFDPTVLPVSARLAQKAKHGEPSLWATSRFEALEQYLRDTLDARSRFGLKLANPLGVG
jgi:hypothetical protein